MTDRIEKTVDLKAPPSRVWRALTDSKEFGEWFRVAFDAPFVVGQKAQGRILHPGYEHLTWKAVIAAIEPERYFAFRWHPYAVDPKHDYSDEPMTLIEFRLSEIAGGTRLSIVESGFENLPPHRREESFPRNSEGWSIQSENIRKYLDQHP
jgi:uncharacterized protein YndB with AHSA1/START domain